MTSPTVAVREQQKAWALSRGIRFDDSGYVYDLRDNLFVPLSPDSIEDFVRGDGGEIGKPDQRGKMQALHSSSALACNVFEYWRGRDASGLRSALGLEPSIVGLGFERKFPIFSGRHAPNLDVVLTLSDCSILAIESKFMEPFAGRHSQEFGSKYFAQTSGLWTRHGFPACQLLAEQVATGVAMFRYLDARQLLKHILGLASQSQPWELLYLYFDVPGSVGAEHAAEARLFCEVTRSDGIRFRTVSYQSLADALQQVIGEQGDGYLAYLNARYFRDRVTGAAGSDIGMRLTTLFEEEPDQWGLRGDPYLWREMATSLSDSEWPETEAGLIELLERTFIVLTGSELARQGSVFVERYAHGGMSSGQVSMEFWREKALPLLRSRYSGV